MTMLENILQQAQYLSSALHLQSLHPDLLSIRYELLEVSNRYNDFSGQDESDDTKAHYFLASSNTNVKDSLQRIGLLHLHDTTQSLADVESDIDGYVRYRWEKGLIAIIAARRQQANADFQAYVEQQLRTAKYSRHDNTWESIHTKDQGTNSIAAAATRLAATSRDTSSTLAHQDRVSDSWSDLPPKSNMLPWDAKQQTYAQAMASLNEHRVREQPVSICSLMSQLVRALGSDVTIHQIADSWQILASIVNEKRVKHGSSTGDLVCPRHYRDDYAMAPGCTPKLRRRIVEGARTYLEEQFFGMIQREIAKHPQEAKLGGIPSIESKIRAFVNIKLSKNGQWVMKNLELINNTPVWAVLFYLIRAGHVMEAAQYTTKYASSLSRLEKNWPTYMAAYTRDACNLGLPRNLAERIQTEFNLRIKYTSESTDPYKHALYKILGRCELSKKSLPAVLPVAEDWMWLQLSLVREQERDDPVYERFNLQDLQTTLQAFGQRHFNARGANPLLYFQMLLLTGQFERAVHCLASDNEVDAVHFAIVLAYYGILHVPIGDPAAIQDLLLIEPKSVTLNFGRFLQLYARSIQGHSSKSALEYLCLLCLNSDIAGSGHKELCHSSLRLLLLETRDFLTLLGSVKADGTRQAGLIEKRADLLQLQDERQYLRTITESAAATSNEDGHVADAILLYHLAEEYDTVVNIVNNSLSEALLDTTYDISCSRDSSVRPFATSQDPVELARSMLDLYSANAELYGRISQHNKDSCAILLSIVACRKQFLVKQLDACLSTIESMSIIPVGESVNLGTIKTLSQNFSILDKNVARNIPDLILLALKCLSGKYEAISSAHYSEQGRNIQMQALKKRIKNLTTYAGLIKYQMSEATRLALEEAAASVRT